MISPPTYPVKLALDPELLEQRFEEFRAVS